MVGLVIASCNRAVLGACMSIRRRDVAGAYRPHEAAALKRHEARRAMGLKLDNGGRRCRQARLLAMQCGEERQA